MRNWNALYAQLTERMRVIAPQAMPDGQHAALIRELELLGAQYEHDRREAIADIKRQLADMDAILNANRLVTVGTLAASMAHELGTPLGVVLARAQMIVADDRDLAEARKDAEEIVHQVQRMTRMCREVLDYAAPTSPTRIAVDVVQAVRKMIELLVPDARKRNVKLVLAGDPAPSPVLGDSSKLMQVLTNLTINAAQSMPDGGVVTVEVERRRVRPPAAEALPDTHYVCIRVRDSGTGIRRADLPHIFETFFTTKKASGGTGLGLAVSDRIAREHDGWIGVETHEGIGSTFTLYVPVIET